MTDHVKDQLCQRIEELEKEKLELNEQLDALQKERDALKAEHEKLVSYTQNGIECFASPCPEHSGVNTPPFSEFWERYGRLCLICVVDERDALAAHVERIIREWISGDDQFSDEWINRMGDIVEDAPETSLARLIAEQQRHALRQAAMRYKKYVTPANLRDFGDELVRQAEGGES